MSRRVREAAAQYGEIDELATLREKNQLTLPDAIARAAGVEPGVRFRVVVDAGSPDVIELRRVRESYAGAFADLYNDAQAYLEDERSGWDRSGPDAA